MPGSPEIRVIIFETSEMGCQLFSQVLEQSGFGVKVIGYSSSGQNLDVPLVKSADVALISAHLRDGPAAGFRLLREMQRHNVNLRGVMLLDRDDRASVVEAFRSGASGICERDNSCEMLCKCIERVHQGQVWANSRQLHYLLQVLVSESPRFPKSVRGRVVLTKREEEIVSLVMEGQKNRDIARQLTLSEHTVKNHLFRIFEKLGISSRTELIAHSMQHGAFPSPPQLLRPQAESSGGSKI